MNVLEVIFLVVTVLLVTHVVFAGYFVNTYIHTIANRRSRVILMFVELWCAVLLLALMYFMLHPLYWTLTLLLFFVSAIIYHSYLKKITSEIELQEFCNYKIYIELCGVVVCFIGIFLLILFPTFIVDVAIFMTIILLYFNFQIFYKKKLYQFRFIPHRLPAQPFVSIIVVAYNEEKYIERTLQCIEHSTYKNFEVIVVDDVSEDQTISIVKKFFNRLPLKIVQKTPRGVSYSRNFGAEHAKGELLLFLDADVIVPSDFLSSAICQMREKKLSIAFPNFVHDSTRAEDILIVRLYKIWLNVVQFYNPRGIGFCLLVLKELHDKVRFDESICVAEDFEYVERATSLGKFRMLHGIFPTCSWRRFNKENRLLLVVKYCFIEFYRQTIGEMRKPIVAYEFGHFNESTSDSTIDDTK